MKLKRSDVNVPMAVALTALLGAVVAFAGQVVDQGSPGNQGPWKVSVVSGAGGGSSTAVSVTEAPCLNPVESFVAYDGGSTIPLPTSALTSRRSVYICNSPKNSGSPLWTIRVDGTLPTTALGSPGQTLNKNDCIGYARAATSSDAGVPIYGIADTAGAVVTITECQ
ncbi:MAG: hypothetical protein KA310_03490 [Pseudomonadales bacterium]|nr:hypothetical protein [Pseudomonadales bacterium]